MGSGAICSKSVSGPNGMSVLGKGHPGALVRAHKVTAVLGRQAELQKRQGRVRNAQKLLSRLCKLLLLPLSMLRTKKARS